RQEALENLKQLDRVLAVNLGLARPPTARRRGAQRAGPGRRPAAVRGVRSAAPCHGRGEQGVGQAVPGGVRQVPPLRPRRTGAVLQGSAAWPDDEAYAYNPEYLERTTIKQAMKWLAKAGHFPADRVPHLPLAKPVGTTTYCWTPAEVQAVIGHCRADPALDW